MVVCPPDNGVPINRAECNSLMHGGYDVAPLCGRQRLPYRTGCIDAEALCASHGGMGTDLFKPKIQYALHLPDHLRRWGFLLA